MTETMASEFPFVEQLPKREKSRLLKLWDHFAEARALTKEHGMLVPVQLAASLAGVSNQRIHQLMEADQLKRVELNGHPFVTENSFVVWAQSERKNGRPFKDLAKGETWKLAKQIATERVTKNRKKNS